MLTLNNKKKIIFTASLAFLLILTGVSSFLVSNALKKEGAAVIVTVNGEQIASYPLTADGTYLLNGGTNVLVIREGKAYVESADCPDKICVNHHKISKTGERIICLPNKLEIAVIGSDDEIFTN